MEFSPFDPDQASEQDFRAITELYAAVDEADRPEWPTRSYQAVVGRLKSAVTTGPEPTWYWLARQGGRLAAVGFIELPQEENTTMALVDVRVHPEFRRQGVGTGFLRVLLSEAKAAGRGRILGMPVREGGPGEPWAEKTGFARAQGYIVQELLVPQVDPALWDVPTAAGYRLREWTGSAPEELLASFATARQAISDAPVGEMTWGDPAWTPERVRLGEAASAASNEEQRVVVAVHEATGAVAGLTELFILAHEPEHGRQHDTAVLAEHRGHGLGRAMKSAMLRRLVVEHPETVRVSTQTAADNAFMAAVNHQIGYHTLWTHFYVEADVEDLEKQVG